MTCSACGHENRPGAKFCEECAAPLARACASCGAALRPTAKFCDECATPVAGAAPAARPVETAGARKVVTIVFADLVGSTALHERVDPESARRFMEGYYDAMRGAVEAHGGHVTQLLGDGVKAIFGAPRVAEDDAIRAVRAAVEMQRAFRKLAEQRSGAVGKTGLRVAVNTGEVVANDDTEIIGDPVNVAARLQEQGREGDVVIGGSTQRLVSALVTLTPLGSFTLKGRSEAVKAWRVESLDPPAGVTTAAFVGRDEELARIAAVYEAAISAPAARMAVLLGSPGLGKSRLIDEFARRLDDAALVVTAQCDEAGGASFAPLAEALRELLCIDDASSGDALRAAIANALPGDDAERARIVDGIAALLAGSPASPEETFFVVRRLLGAFAARRPLVLVVDDLQWAEPLLLDLVEHLVQWGSGVPLLVLVGARPELRDRRSSLTSAGGLVSEVLTLGGLDAGAAMRLAANVIGAADLPAAVAARVLATSEGNPLFVGELVRMLVYEGALKQEGERWITGVALAALEMPPTIHALLAARIERLRPEERGVLERAAVIGRVFSRGTVAALLPGGGSDLDARLESLRRSELVESDAGWFFGEPALRFHHVLIRDAAYRRLLKGTRAELHERIADWIEARAPGAVEHDETLGWHLEQAHQHLAELGPLDDAGRALGERAARHLAAAGRRALARDDLSLASGLLGRALGRLDAHDPTRAHLALDWCEALLAGGDVGPAAAAIDELERFIAGSDRLRAWHTCFASQLTVLTAPQGLQAAADAVAEAAQQLTALGDAAGEAKAHSVHAQALARLGKMGACEAALDQALAAARRAGDTRRSNAVLAGAPLAALWGPSPVTRASGRCLDVVRVLRITQGAPAVEAVALSCQGVLEALRGRTDAARRMIASARKMVEELGIASRLFEADVFAGRIETMEGDSVAAERLLRGAFDGLRDLGLGIDAAQAGALLARVLLAQDRVAEAEALSHESEALAGDDLQAAIAWRGVRAEALAKRGEHAAAIELAQAAVAIASATDALLDHARARMALAAALRAAGRGAEADAEERRAIELWEAKGATLLAERVRREGASTGLLGQARAARVEPAPPVQRRVRANLATENCARLEAVIAARDAAALPDLLAESYVSIHHPTGTVMGPEGPLAIWHALLQGEDPALSNEILATLGDSLALVRGIRSSSAQREGEGIDVGAALSEEIAIVEVDARGQTTLAETFASHHCGEAIARLYERHAELLPEGPERERAAAIARSIATLLRQPQLEAWCNAIAPAIELVDHRVLGLASLRGSEAMHDYLRAMFELEESFVVRVDDVLAAESGALLFLGGSSGLGRASGGAYERRMLQLWVLGDDGLLERIEYFEAERPAEALARFDMLVPSPVGGIVAGAEPRRPVRHRVRPNAASAAVARLTAAFAARDITLFEAEHSDDIEVTDHRWHTSYGRDGTLKSWRAIMRPQDAELRVAPVATLGEWLTLDRYSYSSSGGKAGGFDVGENTSEFAQLLEVDLSGRVLRNDFFPDDRLGAAITRLYERYAELLPRGAERTRAEAIARSARVMLGQPDLAATATVLAPAVEFTDLRTVGFGTLRGAATVVDTIASMMKLSSDDAARIDDVLVLEADALIVRWTNSGTDRATGGVFERKLCQLFTFDERGLVARWQQFEVERAADALARFDELTGSSDTEPAPEPFANAASRANDRLDRCFNARDWARVEACVAPSLVFDERRRMVRNTCGREIWLEQFRVLFDVPAGHFASSLLATRGERISLHLTRFEGKVAGGGGPLAMDDHLALQEVDGNGRIVATVLFDQEDLDAAHAELDARFDAGEGAAYARTLAAWRGRERAWATRDWDALSASRSPGFVFRDHRRLGWGTTMSDWVSIDQITQSLVDLAPDVRRRHDHVRLCERGILEQMAQVGTHDGGVFENVFLAVYEWDAQGRCQTIDNYDVDRLDLARARFEELEHARPQPRFANAAWRAQDQGIAAWLARDWDAYARVLAPEYRQSDRRRLLQLELDREQAIAFTRQVGDMASTRVEAELLATRGDRLALSRLRAEVAEGAVGPSEIVHLQLIETNDRAEWIATVRFDVDDTDAAYAELDARWDAGEAATNPRASAWMSAFRRSFDERDWEALAARCAPTLVAHDHRLVGWGTLRGPEKWIPTLEVLVELSPDAELRLDHLRTSERGVLFEGAWRGTRDGGAFEAPMIAVIELDESGRQVRLDVYDTGKLDEARGRFVAIGAGALVQPPRLANTAMHGWLELLPFFASGDSQGFAKRIPAGMRYFDRSRMARLELDRDGYLEYTRPLREMRSIRLRPELLATRGERLALARLRIEVADVDVGPSEIVSLILVATDERGALDTYYRFDADDLDAAYDELEALWQAGEATAHPAASTWVAEFQRAFAARDWAALAALHAAPDQVAQDHRMVGWGTKTGPGAWVPTVQALVELSPDARLRLAHLRTCERGVLWEAGWIGTRDGGAFETQFMSVFELDELGRQRRLDVWDVEKLDTALARFDEIAASATKQPARFENSATRTAARAVAAFEARDWKAFAALFAPRFRNFDRRALFQLESDREQWLAMYRQIVEMTSSRPTREVLATRGERLAIVRVSWQGAEGDVGPSEIDWLLVIEVDERGDHVAVVTFDPDALDAAWAELDARWDSGEATAHPRAAAWAADDRRAVALRDWDALSALGVPELVAESHRMVSWGTLHGAAAWTPLKSLVELSADIRLRVDHLRICERGVLWEALWQGSRDGGEFEIPLILVATLDELGRSVRIDTYDIDRLAEARVRFDAIAASAAPDPLRIPPNAATRAGAQLPSHGDAALRALVTDDFCFDDRGRRSLVRGGVEDWLRSRQFMFTETGARSDARLVATAGDRLALDYLVWHEGPGGTPFEIQRLRVTEVDAAGKLRAIVLFDSDQRAAASAELFERYVAGGADGMPASDVEYLRAINGHDLDRLRAVLPDDSVFHDHRRTGLGRIDGAEAYIASLAAFFELSPDARVDELYQIAVARHARVAILYRSGTNTEGGESVAEMVRLSRYRGERLVGVELFELEDLDAALARFEELRPDPLRIPPNAATRALAKFAPLRDSIDLAALRAVATDDFCYDDRGRRSLVRGGVEEWLRAVEFLRAEAGVRFDTRLIATAGDRLALHHVILHEAPGGSRFEIENLRVTEVDAAGKLRALVLFDPDQRAAASAELFERWAANGADGLPIALADYVRAWNDHDLDRVRALLPDDFTLHDRRRTGIGRVDREGQIAALAALYELIPDVRFEILYRMAQGPHGFIGVNHWWGTNAEGGEVEAVFVGLTLFRDERTAGIELFELEDLDTALARFEELRPDP